MLDSFSEILNAIGLVAQSHITLLASPTYKVLYFWFALRIPPIIPAIRVTFVILFWSDILHTKNP